MLICCLPPSLFSLHFIILLTQWTVLCIIQLVPHLFNCFHQVMEPRIGQAFSDGLPQPFTALFNLLGVLPDVILCRCLFMHSLQRRHLKQERGMCPLVTAAPVVSYLQQVLKSRSASILAESEAKARVGVSFLVLVDK